MNKIAELNTEPFQRRIVDYSPLALAYIGDAVFEVYVRTLVTCRHNTSIEKVHKYAVDVVNAKAQMEFFHEIKSSLTEKEMAVYKRGRNAKAVTSRRFRVVEYITATGLETLLGHLYVNGDTARLFEILERLKAFINAQS